MPPPPGAPAKGLNCPLGVGVGGTVPGEILRAVKPSGAAGEARYEFLKELGSDALGSLWLARITEGAELGRLVSVRRHALSTLPTTSVVQLQQRASAYHTIVHASVARLLAVEVWRQELLLVSEYVEGIPLGALMRQSFESGMPLPPPVAVRLVLDIARSALAVRKAAAELGLPIPPRLVYVEGIQCAAFGEALLTEVGALAELASDPPYSSARNGATELAPEEPLSRAIHSDTHEVFTLGVLLWELLMNRRLRESHRSDPAAAPSPERRVPSLADAERPGLPVPTPLVRLVESATELDARRRCPSLAEFAARIAKLPPRLVGDENQVRECLLERAGRAVESCRRAAGLPAATESHEPVDAESLPQASAEDLDHWDKPTLPGHRLSPPTILALSPGSQRPSEPNAIVLAESSETRPLQATSTRPATLSYPPPAHHHARTLMALALGAVLGAGSLVLMLVDSTPGSSGMAPRRATAASVLDPSSGEAPALPQTVAGPTPELPPASASVARDPSPRNPDPAESPDAGPGGSQLIAPAADSSNSTAGKRRGVFRPRSIAPYRPKGI